MPGVRFLSVFLSCLLLATTATADEVRLRNGDRLTGTVVQLGGGTLRFKTAHGELTIPWPEVEGLRVDTEILVTTVEGEAVTVAGGEINVANTQALARPRPALEINGGAGAGIVAAGGNTSVNSLRLDSDAVVRYGENRYTLGAEINQATDRGVKTAQNWTASARYDRFLTSRLFVNANAIFTDDRFRDIDLRAAYGAGFGYQVADTPALRLSVDGGVGYVDENFQAAPDDSYAALRESAKLDVIVVADHVTVFHQHDSYFGVTGDDNLFVNTFNGVRLAITSGVIATVRLDVDYDRTPAPGLQNVERTFALTLGYRF